MECFFTIQTDRDKELPLWITGIGWDKFQTPKNREEDFSSHQLAFCEKGTGKYRINGKEYTIEKGMLFFFPANIPHEYYPVTEQWSLRWILFNCPKIESLLKAIDFPSEEAFRIRNSEDYVICYNLIWNLLISRRSTGMSESSGIFYRFLTGLAAQKFQSDTKGLLKKEKMLEDILHYMKNTIQQEVTLEDIAAQVRISPSYLCRIFKESFGISPITYTIRYKINLAKEYLNSHPETTVREVAEISGFHDCSYFCAVFKKYESQTPTQFRDLYRCY